MDGEYRTIGTSGTNIVISVKAGNDVFNISKSSVICTSPYTENICNGIILEQNSKISRIENCNINVNCNQSSQVVAESIGIKKQSPYETNIINSQINLELYIFYHILTYENNNILFIIAIIQIISIIIIYRSILRIKFNFSSTSFKIISPTFSIS